MTQHRQIWMGLLSLALTLTLLPTPVQAANPQTLLPDDTTAIIAVNVRQILDSSLVKKFALDIIKQQLKDQDEVQKVLSSLGLDPLKDIDEIIVAAPEISESPKGLVIINGRYDPAKLKAKAAEVAKAQPDQMKIHKLGQAEVYEIKVPDQPQPMFAAIVDKNTIVAGPSKEYVGDALDKASGKKKTVLKHKEVGQLLTQVNAQQSVWIALSSAALEKGLPQGGDENLKEFLKKIDALAGGISVTDDVKAQFVISAKDAKSAKDLDKTISDGINQGLGILAILSANQKELAPLVDVLKSIKTTAKDKSVIITGTISAELIEKAIKMNQ